MNERQTCGKGLADRSAFPAKLGGLIVAMIENLEAHQETLDVKDEHGRWELRAHVKLAQEFRCLATHLQATAAMARRDPAKMSAPRMVERSRNSWALKTTCSRCCASRLKGIERS